MRAEHRGIKEMDMILGGYVRENLERFNDENMDLLEDFMEINDQRLYQIILGNEETPAPYGALVSEIRSYIEFKPR